MNFDRLNSWLTPIANLGVLIGIFFVASELNLSRAAIQAQTRNELSVQIVDLLSQVATDPELASILNLAMSEAEMSPVQAQQYHHRVIAMLRYWENVHYQYRQGLYDEAEYATQVEAIRASIYVQGASGREIWCSTRTYHSPAFRATFDSLLTAPC